MTANPPNGRTRRDHNGKGLTRPSPKPPGLSSVLERNIETLSERRQQEEAEASVQDKLAQAVTRFTGSMLFVYIHLAIFGFWIIANLGWIPGVPQWDESFVVLAMWASVEAIFLCTFVLISQNRMQAAADKRADLDLQISLLAEHEITKLATLASAIAARVRVQTEIDEELDEIEQDVAPRQCSIKSRQRTHRRNCTSSGNVEPLDLKQRVTVSGLVQALLCLPCYSGWSVSR